MTVKFTQYLMPNGKQREVEIEVNPEQQEKADALIENGAYFDIEVLQTGEVSATCEKEVDLDETQVLAIRVFPNAPGVKEKIEELIDAAYGMLKITEQKEEE